MDSGETYEVVADQRDFAALEVMGLPDEANHTRGRFLAWSVARRTKKYAGSWERFNSVDCAEVSVDHEAVSDELDPGSVDQNGAT